MKKYLFLIFSLFFVSIVSCDNENYVCNIDDESSKETETLRSIYLHKIYGRWTKVDSSLYNYVEEHYNFKSDGTLEGRILLKSRDSVVINGKKELTDWKDIVNKDYTGDWSLLYHSSSKKDVLRYHLIGFASGDADFFNANDSLLEISSLCVTNKVLKMHREL